MGNTVSSNTAAFVIHLLASGKVSTANTWSSSNFTNGGGVAVASDGTIRMAATATSPPYTFAATARTSSAPKGTFTTATGTLADGTDTISDPAQTVITPNGTTIFGGADDAGPDQHRSLTPDGTGRQPGVGLPRLRSGADAIRGLVQCAWQGRSDRLPGANSPVIGCWSGWLAFACDAAEFVYLGGQPVGRGEVVAPA